jgi:transposase
MNEALRFVAFDVHKSYVLVAALDATLQVVLPPRRVRLDDLPEWAAQTLRPTDRGVLEATSNAWTLYDLLAPLVAEVQVAHPLLVKLISSARVKTDTRDTLHLARLLAANLIPTVWVPPPPVRELRALVAHRERLVRQRTQTKNRVSSLLQSYNLAPPEHEAEWQQLPLAPPDRFRLQQDRLLVEQLGELIRQADTELTRLSVEEPWARSMVSPFAVAWPGHHHQHDHSGGDWRDYAFSLAREAGRLQWAGRQCPCLGADLPNRRHHQTRSAGIAHRPHRSRLDCRAPPSLLASPI